MSEVVGGEKHLLRKLHAKHVLLAHLIWFQDTKFMSASNALMGHCVLG